MMTETSAGIDFEQSEGQAMVTQMVRDFCEKYIRPNIMKWDESQEFPIEIFHEMGKLGLMGDRKSVV